MRVEAPSEGRLAWSRVRFADAAGPGISAGVVLAVSGAGFELASVAVTVSMSARVPAVIVAV